MLTGVQDSALFFEDNPYSDEPEALSMGGKPNPGTPADKRLKGNKGKGGKR